MNGFAIQIVVSGNDGNTLQKLVGTFVNDTLPAEGFSFLAEVTSQFPLE